MTTRAGEHDLAHGVEMPRGDDRLQPEAPAQQDGERHHHGEAGEHARRRRNRAGRSSPASPASGWPRSPCRPRCARRPPAAPPARPWRGRARHAACQCRAEPRQPRAKSAVEHAAPAAPGARSRMRGEIGDQPDVPEQDGEDDVGGDRREIPDQRAAPLRPELHRIGVGREPVEAGRAARDAGSGNSPAMVAANSVIASAKRLIEARQLCRVSSSSAEISVPALPMPSHQT